MLSGLLAKRPMKRIIDPLSKMGAKISSNENKLPLKIEGQQLNSITYHSPIASAQVKSCLMLAGLGANGTTKIYEPTLSRNHSEIMLNYLGAEISTGKDELGYYTEIKKSKLTPKNLEVVGDISSAAFFMVAAAIVPNSSIIIKNVGINPTRTGIINVFKQAEIDFELLNQKTICNEQVADIKVSYTKDIKPFKILGNSLYLGITLTVAIRVPIKIPITKPKTAIRNINIAYRNDYCLCSISFNN